MKKIDLSKVLTPEELKDWREEVRQKARAIPATRYLVKSKNGLYCCPLCGSGTGENKTGAVKYYRESNKWFCHACKNEKLDGKSGDTIDAIQYKEGAADYYTALEIAADEVGLPRDQYAQERAIIRQAKRSARDAAQDGGKPAGNAEQGEQEKAPANGTQEATETIQPDYMAYYEQCADRLKDPAAIKYLNSRAISYDTAAAYGIGFDPAADPANAPGAMGNEYKPHPCPRLIIPTSTAHYVGRRIDGQKGYEKINAKDSSPALFNAEALDSPAEVIFIAEGVFDALSLLQEGEEAIATNGKGNGKLLLQRLQESPAFNCLAFVVVPDNDSDPKTNAATQKTAEELKAELHKLGYAAIVYNVAGEYKDANAALVADQAGFVQRIEKARRAALRGEEPEETAEPDEEPDTTTAAQSVTAYLHSGLYEHDIEYFKAYKDRKIGYPDIDKYLTLYPGLAFLGGASSLGKTTFVVNIIDKLLQRGETVLYFSLEQLPIEIITKSLARMIRERDPFTRLTNEAIKNGATSDKLEAIKKEYAESAGNYHIITGDFRMKAADIVEYVEKYRAEHGGDSCRPIVIIDYLQLIAPPDNFRGGIRETTDENIKALKDMQKNNKLFVIVISSFNRSSNYEPVSYESFKETSMIEFTADYIWGLQLSILDAENIDFYTVTGSRGGRSERPLDQKRRLVNEAQSSIPKKVEFVSLKNRNGKQFFKAFFDYYPQHDMFVPADPDGFTTHYGDTPFSDTAGTGQEVTARF